MKELLREAFEAGGDFRIACKNLTDGVIDKIQWSEVDDFDEWYESKFKNNGDLADVSDWVAVSERLPPNETKEYEVCRDGNVEFDVWYYRDGKGYWYNYLGITHWKEKPEPPCR